MLPYFTYHGLAYILYVIYSTSLCDTDFQHFLSLKDDYTYFGIQTVEIDSLGLLQVRYTSHRKYLPLSVTVVGLFGYKNYASFRSTYCEVGEVLVDETLCVYVFSSTKEGKSI